jgi:hypothetical protein
MLRNISKDEMIEKYRQALALYADTNNWIGNVFRLQQDMNNDDCAGKFCLNGEIARQALLYNENRKVNDDK